MSLADRLSQAVESPYPVRCHTCLAMADMPDDEREALEQMLADKRRFSGSWIAKAMQAEGWSVKDSSVRKHRRECRESR